MGVFRDFHAIGLKFLKNITRLKIPGSSSIIEYQQNKNKGKHYRIWNSV
jgi:hypothetical protein